MDDTDHELGGMSFLNSVIMVSPESIAKATRRPDGSMIVAKRNLRPQTQGLSRFPFLLAYKIWAYVRVVLFGAGWRGAVFIVASLFLSLHVVAFLLPALADAHRDTMKVMGWETTSFMAYLSRDLLPLIFILMIFRICFPRLARNHGAEHKFLNAAKAGMGLTFDDVAVQSRHYIHCGTNMVVLYSLVGGIIEWVLFKVGSVYDLISHVITMGVTFVANSPVLSTSMPFVFCVIKLVISIELLRFASDRGSLLGKIILFPGYLVQRITTAEPRARDIELAIAAGTAALEAANGPRL
jgi:uncharacterized protein YqhQ